MPRSFTLKLAFLILPALIGCGSGYEYIAPVTVAYDPSDLEESDLVSYRTLGRADFQAEEPPQSLKSKQNKIAALTTVIVRAVPTFEAVECPSNPDSARWEAIVENLWFDALMNPHTSWWNPKKKKEKDVRQILEHEQIHFAISELEVRKVNAQLDEIVQRIQVGAPTAVDATLRAMERFKAEHTRIMDAVRVWNTKFDLETKNGTDKKAQKKWIERIERRLAETEAAE